MDNVCRSLVEPLENAAADMDVDTNSVPQAPAAAGSSKSTKRSKAAVCTDGPVGYAARTTAAAGATDRCSSPFEAAAAVQDAAEAPAKGTSAGPVGSAAAAGVDGSMLRSDSQSPPYKVPRWRSKQTPSRFCGQKPAAAGAAVAVNGSSCELQQVVVCNQEGHQQHSNITTACPSTPASQPQQQQQPIDDSSQDAVSDITQQLHDQQQQQRWQQLQQQLKSQAAAEGVASRQSEVQQSLQRLQGLVTQGSHQEVEELLEEIQPGFLQEYPVVRFDIKRLHFTQVGPLGRAVCQIVFICSASWP